MTDSQSLSGRTIAHYRILEKLGAGGMGEVYRATDSRLGRDVAIKILPEGFATDQQRMARFEREAQVLAALNHPNIATIYGLEPAGTTRALAMELVPGPTLADRIAQGAMPLDEFLPIARQMAEALEYAHERGIIHRDLKPANIKVTPDGQVKLLDFGLAKALDDSPAAQDISHSPTISALATRAGVILGTAAYMSPEQAKGAAVDRRTDIWAFGVVLYEMLCGKAPFTDKSVQETLARVLREETNWNPLPAETPEAIRRLLKRCLTKDPKRRLRDIGEARVLLESPEASSALEETEASSTVRSASQRRAWQWGIAGILLGALVVGTIIRVILPKAPPRRVQHFSVALPPGLTISDPAFPEIAISPDGQELVFSARQGERSQLYLRRMDEPAAKPIAGTEGGVAPIVSPDGTSVAFVDGATQGLRKVSLTGGPVQYLCTDESVRAVTTGLELSRGSSWSSDGTIYLSSGHYGGLARVSSAGGNCQELTKLDGNQGEVAHALPQVLPGGESLLFNIFYQLYNTDQASIAALSLKTGKWQTLIKQGTSPQYIPGGYLAFARAGTLMAVPFDESSVKVAGSPVPVVESVMTSAEFGSSQFAVASDGTLAYIPGGAAEAKRKLVLVDRSGKAQALGTSEGPYEDLSLSPDGSRVAVTIEGAAWQIGIYDIRRETLTRLTVENDNRDPVWSRDGKRVAYSSFRNGKYGIYWKPADGNGPEEQLLSSADWAYPASFSPDGKALAYGCATRETRFDVWILPLEGERKPRPFANTRFNEWRADFSPNGQWLAYGSDESGRGEIYVQEFPGPGRKWQISNQGGDGPIWSRDGRELFYQNGSKMMAVPIETKPSFTPGLPRQIWEGTYLVSGRYYDVLPGGKQFVFIKEGEQANTARQINVVLNWVDELKRQMAAQKQ